jgi:hypothetical protein
MGKVTTGDGYKDLYNDIFYISEADARQYQYPKDLEYTIIYTIKDCIDKNEYLILALRYGILGIHERHTYKEIGAIFNDAPVSRVQAWVCRALDKLRWCKITNVIKYGIGLSGDWFIKESSTAKYNSNLMTYEEYVESMYNEYSGTSILILELDRRTTRALGRAGILTISDLLSVPPKKLMNTRNIGKKSYAVIEDKLDEILVKCDIADKLSRFDIAKIINDKILNKEEGSQNEQKEN